MLHFYRFLITDKPDNKSQKPGIKNLVNVNIYLYFETNFISFIKKRITCDDVFLKKFQTNLIKFKLVITKLKLNVKKYPNFIFEKP